MNIDSLQAFIEEVPQLDGLDVVTLPDCLPYFSWAKGGADETSDQRCAFAGDLVLTLARKLRRMDALSGMSQVTVETADGTLVIREIGSSFAVACSFQPDLPLGMVHVHVRQLAAALNAWAWQRMEEWKVEAL